MPDTVIQIIVISLVVIAFAFFVAALIFFYTRLTEKNSISTNGELVGFRRYYTTNQWGDNSIDYPENKKGRVPIIKITVDGEKLDIAAATFNYKLTKNDIGKQFRVRYRRFIGITLVIDDGDSVLKYNNKRMLLLWIFISMATIILMTSFLLAKNF